MIELFKKITFFIAIPKQQRNEREDINQEKESVRRMSNQLMEQVRNKNECQYK